MNRILTWLFLALIGLILLIAPMLVNVVIFDHTTRSYTPPDIASLDLAATPEPTLTPAPSQPVATPPAVEWQPGNVVVDVAHTLFLSRSDLEPLANALARRGLGLEYWAASFDPYAIIEPCFRFLSDAVTFKNCLKVPDQSSELAKQVKTASALVVISPFFRWSPQEVQVAKHFVADGGRLLLVSDPDVFFGEARDINNLAEPFGIVFQDDFLYDDSGTTDQNFTHIFVGEFLNQAQSLKGKRVAQYGARSIDGAIVPLLRTASTTLSNQRVGEVGFTTLAYGAAPDPAIAGRVLALSDYEALTQPYQARFDNKKLTDFVADFLAADQRIQTIADFPHYLRRQVVLALGAKRAVDATLLLQGAKLQQQLEAAGHQLTLASDPHFNDARKGQTQADLIYLGDFASAAEDSDLLALIGVRLVTETAILTKAIPLLTAGSLSSTNSITSPYAPQTYIPETGEPKTVEVTTVITTYLETDGTETDGGLRLVADDTVLLYLSAEDQKRPRQLVILAANSAGIAYGINQLLNDDLSVCITGKELTFCPISLQKTPASLTEALIGSEAPHAITTTIKGKEDILLIDDTRDAQSGEPSDGLLYQQVLEAAGYTPERWDVRAKGLPTLQQLESYQWVIWSNTGYKAAGFTGKEIDTLLSYIEKGGHLTLNSLGTFIGSEGGGTSYVRDLAVKPTDSVLSQGLSPETIKLAEDLPPVQILSTPPSSETNPPNANTTVIIERGPTSENAGSPILLALHDEGQPAAVGAKVVVFTASLRWVPEKMAEQLIKNMARWMVEQ